MTMTAPKIQIRRLTIEYISKRCMTGIARTAQHGKVAIDFLRKQHAIPIIRQKSIFQLMECFKIESICHSNGWSMITITPSHIITIFDKTNTWVIAIKPFAYFRIIAFKTKWFFINLPLYTIFAESNV